MDSAWKGSRQLDSNRKNRLIPGPARRPTGHISIQQLNRARFEKLSSCNRSSSTSCVSTLSIEYNRALSPQPFSPRESTDHYKRGEKLTDIVRISSQSEQEINRVLQAADEEKPQTESQSSVECDGDTEEKIEIQKLTFFYTKATQTDEQLENKQFKDIWLIFNACHRILFFRYDVIFNWILCAILIMTLIVVSLKFIIHLWNAQLSDNFNIF